MFKKIKEFVKNQFVPFLFAFFKSKKFHTFLWQSANGFIILFAASLADVDWQYAAVVIAALNWLTKYINKTYLS